jgi:hypothetical protein
MAFSMAKEYVWKEIGDQVVILHLDSGRYYSLNPTGSLVWKGILEQHSRDQILKQVCAAFDVDEEVCRKDVENLVQEFLRKGMLLNK